MVEYFIRYEDMQKNKRAVDLSELMEFVAKIDRGERLKEKTNQLKKEVKNVN